MRVGPGAYVFVYTHEDGSEGDDFKIEFDGEGKGGGDEPVNPVPLASGSKGV